MRAFVTILLLPLSIPIAQAATTAGPDAQNQLYAGWMQMYDLKFDDAHRTFAAWKQSNPTDSLGPASNAAAYLFSELARLGALESELFVDDSRFKSRPTLHPDPAKKELFTEEIAAADRLADTALETSPSDDNALFTKSLTLGLRADDAGLIEKQSLAALTFTKQGRAYAERAIQANPRKADAWLGPGVENYLLSLKAAPVRLFMRLTGSSVDREKGIEQLNETAVHGHYLEPFAKLLLAVAALRDKDLTRARSLLDELHHRFPANDLYTRELNRLPHR